MKMEFLHVVTARVLHTLIRLVHNSPPRLSIDDCALQSAKWKPGLKSSAERPTNDLAREDVQDNRRINKL
jgi:hypothetical protein